MSPDVDSRGWDLGMRVRDLWRGLWYGYPLCCVLRYATSRHYQQAVVRTRLDRIRRRPWRARFSRMAWDRFEEHYSFVACNVFHHGIPWGADHDDY